MQNKSKKSYQPFKKSDSSLLFWYSNNVAILLPQGTLKRQKAVIYSFFRGENLFPLNNADNTPTASGMTRHTNRFFPLYL